MSIRLKFLLSYAAMLVVPLLLLVLTALLLTVVYHGDVQSLKSAYESKFEGMEESDTRNLIKHTFMQNTDLLTDTAFLDELSADMLKKTRQSISAQGISHTMPQRISSLNRG